MNIVKTIADRQLAVLVSTWFLAATLAFSEGLALAEAGVTTPAQARSYILSAFISQAAAANVSERVKLGPELEQRLHLAPGADAEAVYKALVALTDDKPIAVHMATDNELVIYGVRAGLQPNLPAYTVQAGELQLLVQYDLAANNIPFVGQLGLPPPALQAEHETQKSAVVTPEHETLKSAVVTLVWTEQFEYNLARLTPEARAELDADVVPKLKDFAEISHIKVSGHTDYLGSPVYNQRLSEGRAQAVSAYLVSQGADAGKIRLLAYGEKAPVTSCPEQKDQSALIKCLAPNRRVGIEIQGRLK